MLRTARIKNCRMKWPSKCLMRDASEWIQPACLSLSVNAPRSEWQSFRLAIIVNLAVNMQPGFLFVGREILHDFHNVAHHLFADAPYQRRTFGCDAHHHLAPILARHGTNEVTEVLQPRDQP